jgi:hypothetical protein
MKRFRLLVPALAFAACSPGADSEQVAHVETWTLEVSRLADLLVLAQPFPLQVEPVAELAAHWVGGAALLNRMAAGQDLFGPDASAASTWLERREAVLDADRRERLAPEEIEDVSGEFERGEVRLVAHILRRVGPETTLAERDLQRRTVERLLSELVAGGPWDAAVAESDDLETRDAAGLLGLVGPGELPPALDAAAFRLQPGQLSGVVESAAGFHLVYRPRFDDVQDLFARRLAERYLLAADATANSALLEERSAARARAAPDAVRAMAFDPHEFLRSEAGLVAWLGGVLTEGTVARYVLSLPGAPREQLAVAPDSSVAAFLDDIAIREIRYGDAIERGLRVESEVSERLSGQHAAEVAAWLDALGVADGAKASPALLEGYMEEVAARRREALELPPLFEAWLLGPLDWSLSPTGVERAVERARSMLQEAGG